MLRGLCISIALATGLWLGLRAWQRSREIFRVEIVDGKPSAHRGRVPDGLLRDAQAVCDLWNIQRGAIIGEPGAGRRLKIRATGDAAPHEQAFRNAVGHPIEP